MIVDSKSPISMVGSAVFHFAIIAPWLPAILAGYRPLDMFGSDGEGRTLALLVMSPVSALAWYLAFRLVRWYRRIRHRRRMRIEANGAKTLFPSLPLETP